jgi:hypothetical protein
MRKTIKKRVFLKNELAVSEEFTILPALAVVMIGFVLFVILVAQTYTTYEERIEHLQDYQTARSLVNKLTNPDCFFIRNEGLIDLSALQKNNESLKELAQLFQTAGVSFILQLRWNNCSQYFPEAPAGLPADHLAVSSAVGVYINEAQTIPGTLTIALWRDDK